MVSSVDLFIFDTVVLHQKQHRSLLHYAASVKHGAESCFPFLFDEDVPRSLGF